MSEVLTSVEGGVGIVSFNRPDRLNAWTTAMAGAYRRALLAFDADPRVRVIVVTGEGRGFCAGADTGDLADMTRDHAAPRPTGSEDADQLRASTLPRGESRATGPGPAHDPLTGVPDVVVPSVLSKPVIAAINGPAAGIGLGLTLWCDIRFAADDATLTTAFARLGAAAEMGMAYLLSRAVGPSRAADLLFSSRRISGLDAVRMGLVQHNAPAVLLRERAVEYARTMAREISPRSLAMMKQQLWADHNRSLAEALEDSRRLEEHSTAGADFAEGVAALTERRPPRFAPPESPTY